MLRSWFGVFLAMAALVATGLSSDATKRNDSQPIVSHIPRQAIHSSAIAKVGFSKRRHLLEIEFVNGAIYRYLGVPHSVYRDLMSAESKTRFYDFNIRRHYQSVLVRPRQKGRADN